MPTPRAATFRGDRLGVDGTTADPADLVAALDGHLSHRTTASADQHLAHLAAVIAERRPAWHNLAACRGTDVDFTSQAAAQRAAAFTLCGQCDVRLACRDWADQIDDRHSILGGEDPAARRARWRRHPRTPQRDHRPNDAAANVRTRDESAPRGQTTTPQPAKQIRTAV